MAVDARALDAKRWSTLVDFVGRWYREPIQPAEQVDARFRRGPRALQEWLTLAQDRLGGRGHFSFPDPDDFSRWPKLPPRRSMLVEADVERGLLPVVKVGGHGGWGVHREDPDDDPRVHLLELEGQPSESFSGPLSALLTNVVIWETINSASPAAGPLGPLGPGVRRVKVDGDGPAVQRFLRDPRHAPVQGWTLAGDLVRADREGTVLILGAARPMVLTRTQAAWDELQAALRADQTAIDDGRALERRRQTEDRNRALTALGVPTTGVDLLAALDAIEPRLLRFEQAFLADFRRHVRSGTPPPGLLLEAGKILQARRVQG